MLSACRQIRLRTAFVIGALFTASAAPASAELVLTAPPRETAAAGQAVYGPIADYLSTVLGSKVVYQHPASWAAYEARMKRDEFDIVFDGPHFAAWRIQNLSNEPVARLPGSLEFVLVARKDDPAQAPRDLVGRRVCTLPPPNLAGLTVYSMYPNPAQQPEFVILRSGGFKEVHQALQRGECQAGMLRKAFFDKGISEQERAGLRVLRGSSPLLNQGITVSKRITAQQRGQIAQALTSPQGASALQALLQRFAKADETLVAARDTDYRDHNLLHDNMIFGW